MTRRFPETFLTLLGCLLLLASLASAVGAVRLKAAPPTGCSGRLCLENGEWKVKGCSGSCEQSTSCRIIQPSETQNGHSYCGCSPAFEPACCYVYIDENGQPQWGGNCPNCPAPGECGFQILPNGCRVARCKD